MKKFQFSTFCILLIVIAFPAAAANITWSGATNSDWTLGSNWFGGIMPGGADTVFINTLAGPVVSGVSPGAVSVLYTGYNSTGRLTVENGGMIESASHTFLGNTPTPLIPLLGEVTITGAGSTLKSGGDLRIGNNTNGTLNIRNGATARSTGGAYLGYISGLGTVNVSGAGSELIGGTGIVVGNSGHGALTIEDGGKASSTGVLVAANVPASNSVVTLSGTGSTLTVLSITLGNVGTGTMSISNGASASTTGTVNISSSGTGVATVTGVGSRLSGGAELRVGGGNGSNGTLNILNGGTAQSAATTSIGYNTGGTGTVTVAGTGSTLTSGSELRIGNTGTGTLTISDSGKVSSVSHTYIGVSAGSMGAATITGAGSELSSSSELRIGSTGTGTLTIQNGGRASSAANLYVGISNGSSGTLNILDGGKVESGFGNIAQGAGATGSVRISGMDSSWTSGDSRLGQGGNGTMTVENMGSMTTSRMTIGVLAGSSGTLNIRSGGIYTNTVNANLAFGNNAGSTGTVTISDAGSLFQHNGQVTVGLSGTGMLTVSNGGKLKPNSTLNIAMNNGSVGTLNIGGMAGDAPVASGVIDAASITFGSGTGKIVFNHTDADYTFSPSLTGNGTMDFLSGTTTLNGNNSGFTGTMNVADSILRINGPMNTAAATTVADGGRLGGNASIGTLIVQSGGTLAPGNSIGTTNVVNATFNPGSEYAVELNSAGQSDLLAASGTVAINGGTVRVLPYPDYRTGTPYTIISAVGGLLGGPFDNLETSPFITGQLTYTANDVLLTLARDHAAINAVADTPNRRAVSAAASGVSNNVALNALAFSDDAAAVRTALDMLSGELHASLSAAQIEEQASLRAMARKRKPVSARNRHGTLYWMQAARAVQDREGDGNAASLEYRSGGLTVGMERPLGDGYAGFGIGQHTGRIEIGARGSDAKSRDYHLLAYGGAPLGRSGFDMEGGVSLTWHDIESERDIAFPGFSGKSDADYHAQTSQIFTDLSYPVPYRDSITLTPHAEAALVHHRAGSFRESGEAGLEGDATTNVAAYTTLGIDAAHNLAIDADRTIVLEGGVGWQHLFGDDGPGRDLAFRDAAGSGFTARGVPLSRDALAFGAGISFSVGDTVAATVRFGGRLAHDSFDHDLSARIEARF